MPKPVPVCAGARRLRYSICTFVTRPSQYQEMVASFADHGFSDDDCEYLYIDNSEGNALDAYEGANLFLDRAQGETIILCHQDVLLLKDGRAELDAALAHLSTVAPDWALCGNAGGVSPGHLALRISDPHGEDQRRESLPARVQSLDENFIVVRKSANLALSRDLKGFHLYGTELCVVAGVLGHSAHVIDFHLRHLSPGRKDAAFHQARWAMVQKYRRALRHRVVKTPSTVLVLGASNLFNAHYVIRAIDSISGLG